MYCSQAANSLSSLLAVWYSSVEMEQNSDLRSWSLLCRASCVIQHDVTSTVTLIPSLTDKPHATPPPSPPPPIRHPQNVKARWSHVGKLNPGPCAARALVLQRVFHFFFFLIRCCVADVSDGSDSGSTEKIRISPIWVWYRAYSSFSLRFLLGFFFKSDRGIKGL